MYYGNLVLGKRLSALANRQGGGKPAPFNEQTKVTDSARKPSLSAKNPDCPTVKSMAKTARVSAP